MIAVVVGFVVACVSLVIYCVCSRQDDVMPLRLELEQWKTRHKSLSETYEDIYDEWSRVRKQLSEKTKRVDAIEVTLADAERRINDLLKGREVLLSSQRTLESRINRMMAIAAGKEAHPTEQ